jgi:SAM-dependent methyltransferase
MLLKVQDGEIDAPESEKLHVSCAAGQRENLEAIHRDLSEATRSHQSVGQVTRESRSDPGYWVQRTLRRSLAWYTRPIHLFQLSILHVLQRLLATSEAQGSTVSLMKVDFEELREQNSQLQLQVADLQKKVDAQADRQRIAPTAPDQSGMLRENLKIIEYWNWAAETDPMREAVTQWDGESDEDYRNKWKEDGEYAADKIMSYSPPRPRALEIGPGMGRITIPMAKYCDSILALDISPVMAQRAQEVTAPLSNVQVQTITDEDLGFLPPQHFDLAYSIACFQHAEKKSFYRYLEGIRRALKPDGVLFFGVMNLCCEWGWKHFSAILRNDYPEFFHTPDEISCYLTHAGYSSHQLLKEGETLWAIARR